MFIPKRIIFEKNALNYEMGKNIYEKFKDSEISDLDYVAMCEAIEKRDKEMERLEDEIDRIKGVL